MSKKKDSIGGYADRVRRVVVGSTVDIAYYFLIIISANPFTLIIVVNS